MWDDVVQLDLIRVVLVVCNNMVGYSDGTL